MGEAKHLLIFTSDCNFFFHSLLCYAILPKIFLCGGWQKFLFRNNEKIDLSVIDIDIYVQCTHKWSFAMERETHTMKLEGIMTYAKLAGFSYKIVLVGVKQRYFLIFGEIGGNSSCQ